MTHHKHGHDEFQGESPAVSQEWLKTGEKAPEDGGYYCVTCTEERRPPMVNLKKGDMIPPCPTCTPNSRWSKV